MPNPGTGCAVIDCPSDLEQEISTTVATIAFAVGRDMA
jgi:hypothetical protein